MTLPGKFFFWPYAEDLQPCIDELRPLFQESVLWPWCAPGPPAGIAGDLVEFIALLCRTWDVSPWWLVVSAQREQSLWSYGKNDVLPPHVAQAWLGYVAQDVGRTTRPAYFGLYTQVERMVAQTAWYMNHLPDDAWPEHAQKNHALRYSPGGIIHMADGTADKTDLDMPSWVQWQYTPHTPILEDNWNDAQGRVPAKYLLP